MKLSQASRRVLRAVWVLAICAVVVGSLLPGNSPVIQKIGFINDKVLHFSTYLLLAVLPVVTSERRGRGLMTAALMILLGALLEAGQTFSPGRTVELGDVAANTAGVCCGVIAGLPLRYIV